MVQTFLAFLRFLLGLALIPVCIHITRVLVGLFTLLADQTGDELFPLPLVAFVTGFMMWLLAYFLMPRPIRSYVLAHELSHALWGVLMGARVSKLKIRQDGGSVTLSKSNIWITLAPYFFPFYTVLVVLLYMGLSCFWDLSRGHLVWLWIVGVTWSYHCTFTASSLLQHQSDVEVYGMVLSYTLIYFLNTGEVCLGLVAASHLTLEQFITECVRQLDWTWSLMLSVWNWVVEWANLFVRRLQ